MSACSTDRPHPRGRRRTALGLTALVAALGSLVALPPGPALAATSTLAPSSMTTTAGSTGSGQTVANLATQDQSGTQDTYSKYVEFTPGSSTYSGYRTYTMPSSVPASSVTGVQVTANYRGPATGTQTWTWALYDWSAATWTNVGTNATAPSWGSWRTLTFASPSTPSRFVSGTGAVRVRLASNNASDSADVD